MVDTGRMREDQIESATAPLRDDIRFLGAILGETIRDHEGPEVLDLVERVRVEAFRVRRSEVERSAGTLARNLCMLALSFTQMDETRHTLTSFTIANAGQLLQNHNSISDSLPFDRLTDQWDDYTGN